LDRAYTAVIVGVIAISLLFLWFVGRKYIK
jgi:hypothetical protein